MFRCSENSLTYVTLATVALLCSKNSFMYATSFRHATQVDRSLEVGVRERVNIHTYLLHSNVRTRSCMQLIPDTVVILATQ